MSSDPRLLFVMFSGEGRIVPPELRELLPELPENATPEQIANPDLPLWPHGEEYLAQQKARLPWQRYRRLHLNLSGGPEGAFLSPELIDRATDHGILVRPYQEGLREKIVFDWSGGSNDDAGHAFGHWDEKRGLVVIDRVGTQPWTPPFDPLRAAAEVAELARQYRVRTIYGDAFGGQTLLHFFRNIGLQYVVMAKSASDWYLEFEPLLNSGKVRLPDHPKLTEQLIQLVYKGQKVTHPSDGHDDIAVCVAALTVMLADPASRTPLVRSYQGRL